MTWNVSKTEKTAQQCGMTVEQWAHAKKQAHAHRTRGRRATATATEAKLATWGPAKDQIELFTDDTQP